MNKSEQLFEAASAVIPGGVNSPVRAWKSVGGLPRFIDTARGVTIRDVDGREYLDFLASWGPLILGHADPKVVAAISAAAARGTSYGAPSPGEVELAEAIVAAVPSIEKLRLVSSGTEATMSALRLARSFTGRDKVLKFSGCYHGHVDALLVKAGSGAATLGVPDSAGVPRAFTDLTLVAEYNDLASVEAVFAEHGAEIACVTVEPVAGNMGLVPPAPGFLEGLRRLTREAGALLLFDEVITGFRVGRGGYQGYCGVTPDLTALGKVIGGGLPVGAFGGRAEVMDQLAPLGGAYQAGTLSGNPLAVAAGLATLAQLDEALYARIDGLGERLATGLAERLGDRGYVSRVGSMWTIFFGVSAVTTWADAARADTATYARWFHAMIDRGIFLPPSQYETAFVSAAHSEADIDRFLAAATSALEAI